MYVPIWTAPKQLELQSEAKLHSNVFSVAAMMYLFTSSSPPIHRSELKSVKNFMYHYRNVCVVEAESHKVFLTAYLNMTFKSSLKLRLVLFVVMMSKEE